MKHHLEKIWRSIQKSWQLRSMSTKYGLHFFLTRKTRLLAMKVTLMERVDFQLFFNVITGAIDALLHVLWHFSYTLVIKLSRHVAQVALNLVFNLSSVWKCIPPRCHFNSGNRWKSLSDKSGLQGGWVRMSHPYWARILAIAWAVQGRALLWWKHTPFDSITLLRLWMAQCSFLKLSHSSEQHLLLCR